MNPSDSLNSRMNIRAIMGPIFIEQSLKISLMIADVLMLAWYSQSAVAAVGLTSNILFFLSIMYLIVSSGSGILIGQHLGANEARKAQGYAQSGLLLSLVSSIAVGALFYFGTVFVIDLYTLEPDVRHYAVQYALITGTLSIGLSVGTLLSTVLRAHGYSFSPMLMYLVGGVINVIGNYIALFGPFGLPITGVVGVAFATVASQIITAVLCWVLIRHHRLPFSLKSSFTFDRKRFSAILALGLPTAGEGVSYNLAQLVIVYFIAQLGTAALAATAIALTLARVIFVFSLSLGISTQIISSYLVGQARYGELKHQVINYCKAGILVSFSLAVIMALLGSQIASWFSDDDATQFLVAQLLVVWVFLEPGRAINLTVIFGLKGAGDVLFPVQIGILVMWGVGVLMAYLLGIHWGYGLIGIWIAVGLDEWVRGLIMIARWRSDRWINKSTVKAHA